MNIAPKTFVTTRAGALQSSANGRKWWVESNSRRVRSRTLQFQDNYMKAYGMLSAASTYPRRKSSWWVPAKMGEDWRVDVGGAHLAVLDGYEFEGATKRNKSNLKVRLIHLWNSHTQRSFSFWLVE